MFAFDIDAPWGWTVIGACDYLWIDRYDFLTIFIFGELYYSTSRNGICSFGAVAGSVSVYWVGACDYLWCHEHVELMCIWVGEYLSAIPERGGLFTFEIGDMSRFWEWVGACDNYWSSMTSIIYAAVGCSIWYELGQVGCFVIALDGYGSGGLPIFGACDVLLYRRYAELRCSWVGESMGSDRVGGGLFSFEVGDILEYWYWLGACDYYWRSYGTTFTLAACGGDIRYIVGHIGSLCLCLQFKGILAEFTLGAY